MTSIEWMSIQGIRSFSPDQRKVQKIKFFKPLTIILGHNGAGKTTIIEALKNACTGEVPPNTGKGQSFIHDPKISGDTQVKAQIKLQFRAANKKPMVVVRSYQLTQKKEKLEFKQTESAIQTRNDAGEIVSQSYKPGEIDKLIPEFIGVSQAVLENVIFCHQEDVNWPLSESTKLKKKFDDIFAATRYTKALESIKKYKKSQGDLLKEHSKDLSVLDAHRDQAHKIRKETETEKHKIETTKAEIEEINKQMAEYESKIRQLSSVLESIRGLGDKIKEMKAQEQMLKATIEEMYDNMETEFTESDEEVQQYQQEYRKQLADLKASQEAIQRELQKTTDQADKQNQEIQKLIKREGELAAEVKAHEQRVEKLCTQIHSLAKRYDVPGYENPPYSYPLIFEFGRKVDAKIAELKKELTSMKDSHRVDEESLSSSVNKAQLSLRNIDINIKDKERRLGIYKNELNSVKSKMDQIKITEADIKNLEDTIAAKQAELDEKIKRIDSASGAHMKKLRDEIQKNRDQLTKLKAEMDQRQLERDASVRLNVKRGDLEKRQEELGRAFDLLKDKLQKVNILESDPAKLKAQLATTLREKKSAVEAANKKYQELDKRASATKQKLSHINEEMNKLRTRLQNNEQKLSGVCPEGAELSVVLKEAEDDAKDLRSELSLAESLKMCYENFMNHANDHKECPVCERSLATDELANFVTMQREKLNRTPQVIANKKKKLEKAEELCARLRGLVPINDEIQRIKKADLPSLEQKKKEVEREEATVSEELEDLASTLAMLKHEEKQATDLVPEVDKVTLLCQEITKIQGDIATEERRIRAGSQNNRSYDDVSRERDELQKATEKLDEQLDTLRKEHDTKQSEIAALTKELSNTKDKLAAMKRSWDEKTRLQQQYEKVSKEAEIIQQDISTDQSTIPGIRNEMEGFKGKLEKLKANNRQEEARLQAKIDEYQRDVGSMNSLLNDIQKYVADNKEQKFKDIQKTQESYKKRYDELIELAKKLSEEAASKKELIDKQDVIQRNIDDNINYRRKKREYEQLCADLKRKQEELAKATGSMDEKALEAQKNEMNKLANQKSKLEGMVRMMEDRVSKNEKELSSELYHDIDARYKSALIKLKTTEMANQDLEKYYKALEKALMSYHSLKMAEINEIIKELWQKTYRGQDIDSIEIRADHEPGAKRGSFNYRVVMKKGDIALDMRGRCSAGQKVLACLVIRLALAEAFSVDCGVMALDEPTTNLDAENVESLAIALQTIISDRRKQSNFQFVVITHDEEFVRKMGKSEYVDYYYRIHKDPETQESIITREDARANL